MISEQNDAMREAEASVNRFLAQYLESQVSLWDSYVDPREAYLGEDGELWNGIGLGFSAAEDLPFRTTAELFQIQSIGRYLWRENEFASNGHKNRLNYIIGWGHVYTVVGKSRYVDESTLKRVQGVLDEILEANRWTNRQREIKLRDDRDGETFIRKFRGQDGIMRFRFVEPRQVQPPGNAQPNQSMGVETLPNDIETPVAYWIDGSPVDASEIQHRKFNVDCSIKRGLSLMYPVRKNLIRAEKLLRNMSLATEIQTAIALIRRHKQATQQAVRSFVQAKAELQQTNPNGKTENVLRYGPGSILDVPANQEYDVPKQLDPSKTISALQAELRAIASHLVMPEFMLSSDASNANYASTMVAEGPAVKNFEAEQQVQIEYDLELLDEAMRYAVDSSLLSRAEWEACKIDVQPPTVQVRDRLQEAQIRQIDMGLGILSPQTATAQAGNDYEQEQTNRELHEERTGGVPGFSFSGQSQSTESHDVALENCGIGPNGFTSGNTCAKGGGSVGRSSKASKRKKTKKKKKRNKRLTISQAANALSAKGYTLLAPDPWTPETGVVYNIVDPSGKKIKVKAADVADLID